MRRAACSFLPVAVIAFAACVPTDEAPAPPIRFTLTGHLTAEGTGTSLLDLCIDGGDRLDLEPYRQCRNLIDGETLGATGADGPIPLSAVPTLRGTEYQQTIASDAAGASVTIDWSPWAGGAIHGVVALPAAPVILAPVDGATVSLATLGAGLPLQWQALEDADQQYDVELACPDHIATIVHVSPEHGATYGDVAAAALDVHGQTCRVTVTFTSTHTSPLTIEPAPDTLMGGAVDGTQTRAVRVTLTP